MIYFINRSFQSLTGFSAQFFEGKEWTEVFKCSNGSNTGTLQAMLAGIVLEGADQQITQCAIATRQGLLISGDLRILPIREKDETTGAMFILISQQPKPMPRQPEREPAANQSAIDADLAAAFYEAPIPMILIDQDRRVRLANRAMLQFTGGNENDPLGRTGGEVLHCVYSLQDPRGCGFGEKCRTCLIRSTVTDALEYHRHHRKVEVRCSINREQSIVDKTVLLSASPLKTSDQNMVLVSIEDITEQKAAEEALKESESAHRSLMESTSDAILIVDAERLIVSCNQAFLNLFGYERKEAIGASIRIIHPSEESFTSFGEKYPKVESEGAHRLEWLYRHKDGHTIPAETVISPIRTNGEAKRYVAIIRDMTEHKEAEELLTEYMRAVEGSGDLIAVVDTGYVFKVVNEAYLAYLGKTRDQVVGRTVAEVLGEELFERVFRTNLDLCLRGDQVHFEIVREFEEMGKRFLSIYYYPIKDGENRVSRIVCVVRDITSRRELNQEREFSSKFLKLLNSTTEVAPLASGVIDLLSEYTGCEAAGIHIIDGNDPAFFTGKGFPAEYGRNCGAFASSCYFKDSKDRSGDEEICALQTVFGGTAGKQEKGFTTYGTFWTRHLSSLCPHRKKTDHCCAELRGCLNDYQYESLALVPLRTEENIFGILVIADRRPGILSLPTIRFLEQRSNSLAIWFARYRAEEERKRLSMAVEQTGELIVITDRQGVMSYVNPAAEQVTGYSAAFLQGKLVGGFVQGSTESSHLEQLFERAGRGESWTGNLSVKKKDGRVIDLIANIAPLRDDSGDVRNFVCVARDVTHEIDLERQLRQSQKLEAIGTLAGGIAHDFNNILGAIAGYTELTILDLPSGDRLSRNLHHVLKGCQRAKDLVKQILAFSRQSEQECKPVKVSLIVKEAIKLLRASLPSSIEIRQEMAAENDIIMADPTQVHQIMMNLCTNAAHAMQDKGGLLKVVLKNVEMNAPLDPSRDLPNEPRTYLELTVSDTGHGIDSAIIDRIFDPFFTTKRRGEGTGMGLSVIHGIVKSRGGSITVESEANRGSSFHVFLPCCAALVEEERHPDVALLLGKGRILLVDDEKVLVEMGKQMLEYLGYEVTGVQSSIEALELFSRNPSYFDAVVTDYTMPKMNGISLARAMLAIRPQLPVLLCTGYSESITEKTAKEIGIRQIIMKPVILSEMGALLKTLIHLNSNEHQ